LLSTYPMAGYVSLTKLPEVVSDADRKDSVHLGAEEEEHEQDRLQGELQQAELKPMYSEPAFIRTPSHVANPKEVIVNVVSPVVPEKEIYDERQLPSFLIAEKLLNKYFTRGASEAQPTSFEFQKAAIPSIVVEQPHLDSGLRTVPSTETFEGNESSDEELRYRFKTDRFKPLVRRIAEDAPAAAERDDLGNYSREDSQKELLDEPMMTKEEVAAFFNVSPNTIDNWRKSPDFPEAIQLGSGSLRWERAEIRHYKDLRKSK
jgi:predicted DNA-binding transcriptional regulator AlpA